MEFKSFLTIEGIDKKLLFQPELLRVLLTMEENKVVDNLIISGPVGCGQGLASRFLKELTPEKNLIKVLPSQFLYPSAGESIAALEIYLRKAYQGVLYIPDFDEIEHNPYFIEILNYLRVATLTNDFKLILSGDKVIFDKTQIINPELFSRFTKVEVKNFTTDELVELFFQELRLQNVDNDLKHQDVLPILENFRINGNLRNGRITRLLVDLSLRDMRLNKYKYLSKVSLRNTAQYYLRHSGESGFQELDELIGLVEVKNLVKVWMQNLALNERRKQIGINVEGFGQHMVFKGPAGTAKTTVARIVGKILAETGLLTSGHYVESAKTDFVGRNAEETTRKTTAKVMESLGGVLFIDEAYSLTSGNEEEAAGKDVIDTLIKLMEDKRDQFVLIVAGYDDKMKDFLLENPGLQSRFSKILDFPNYTVEELLEILHFLANKRGFIIEDGVDEYLYPEFSTLHRFPGFGNGREIRNILEDTIYAQGLRIVGNASDDELRLLKLEDFQNRPLRTRKNYL